MDPNEPLQLNKSPSPAEEARSFENLDEKAKREHQLALMTRSYGAVGGFLGSAENKPLNIAFCVIVMIVFLVVAAFAFLSESTYVTVVERLLAVLSVVIGFVFGKVTNSRPDGEG